MVAASLPASPAGRPLAPRTAGRGLGKNGDYLLYLIGNVASWGGLAVADVLLLWLVYNETLSTISVAYIGLAEALPAIIVGLPAGVLADRYDRRNLLMITAVLQAAALALIILSLRTIGFNLGILFGLVLALEAVTVVFRPTSYAILPGLVHPDDLDNANGLVQATTSVAATVGAALAAALLVVLGMYPTFLINLAILLFGGVLFAAISRPYAAIVSEERRENPVSLREEMMAGIAYLRTHRALLELTAVSVAAGFFVEMFSPFLVVYTARELGQEASLFGYLLASYSAGFFLGSIIIGRLGIVRLYGRFFAVALVMSGGLLSLLVFFPTFAVALGALTGVGMLLGLVVTGFSILIQRVVPANVLGRYLGLDETLTWATAPLGILLGGVVMQSIGILVGIGIAFVGLIATGLFAYALPGVRQLGFDPSESPGAPPPGATLHPEDSGRATGGDARLPAEPSPVPDQVGA